MSLTASRFKNLQKMKKYICDDGYVAGSQIFCPAYFNIQFEIVPELRGFYRSGTRVIFTAEVSSDPFSPCYIVTVIEKKNPREQLPVKYTHKGPAFSLQMSRTELPNVFINSEFGLISDPEGVLSHQPTYECTNDGEEEEIDHVLYYWVIEDATDQAMTRFTVLQDDTKFIQEEVFDYPRRCLAKAELCECGDCQSAALVKRLWQNKPLYSHVSATSMELHLEIIDLLTFAAADGS